MIMLHSPRLRIEMAEPGEKPATGFRFDHCGFITEVVLDGKIRFCASEPHNLRHPSSGGRGLCNEWRFTICEDVEVGDWFPKFGIGLLRKEEEGRYVFYKKFKQSIPFVNHVVQDGTSVSFMTEPNTCQGYALRSVKTVSVHDNVLTMTVEAENTGDKTLSIEEFCHNFISIDGMALGSDYRLDLPGCPSLGYHRLDNRSGGRPGSMRGNGKGLTFCEFSAIDTDYAIEAANVDDAVPFMWRLTHLGARSSVEGLDYFKPHKIAIWAVDHMVCPEIVHNFNLTPGQQHTWKRQWTFTSDDFNGEPS